MELTTPLIIGFLGGFFMLAVLSLTSFVKISVIFLILRNAIGLQQIPSNMIVMGLSFFLSIYIAMPVVTAAFDSLLQRPLENMTLEELFSTISRTILPFQQFVLRNTAPETLDFFVEITNEVWRGSGLVGTKEMLVVQVPAFLLSELTNAFEIGFLLYLPFITIDLAVTGILMALGMQQVQPTVIAAPFKLLLFVFLDGWMRLAEGLLLSYAA